MYDNYKPIYKNCQYILVNFLLFCGETLQLNIKIAKQTKKRGHACKAQAMISVRNTISRALIARLICGNIMALQQIVSINNLPSLMMEPQS